VVNVAGDLIQWIAGIVAVLWLTLAFRTKRTVARSGGMGRLAVVAVLLAIVLARPMARTSLHSRLWAPSSDLSLLALVLVVAGAAFAIWARLTIGTNWSGTVTLKEDHELIQRGPYRVVRHPIYTGLLFMGLGAALQFAESYSFVLLVVVTIMFAFKMRLEEKLMTQNFPDQYPAYRRRVKAIIHFIL
jgi:protein-S-isoprenylcysteine O-methyltransferase Ste14